MEISKRIIERLETFVSKGPEQVEAVILDSTRQSGYIVGLPTEAQAPSVSVTLQDYDRYSVALRHLEVGYGEPYVNESGKPADDLRYIADRVAQQLTYLEEPLVLLELDAGEGLAQLRSDPPHQDGDQIIYWEAQVRLKPQLKVSLARYRWTPDRTEPESLVYPATFATLGRITADLASSLSTESSDQ